MILLYKNIGSLNCVDGSLNTIYTSPVVKWLSLLTLNQASQVRILAEEKFFLASWPPPPFFGSTSDFSFHLICSHACGIEPDHWVCPSQEDLWMIWQCHRVLPFGLLASPSNLEVRSGCHFLSWLWIKHPKLNLGRGTIFFWPLDLPLLFLVPRVSDEWPTSRWQPTINQSTIN